MAKKLEPMRPIHTINLSLPIVRNDSYEIYYSMPASHSRQTSTVRPVTRQNACSDNSSDENDGRSATTATSRARSLSRLKQLTGPVLVNLFVKMPFVPLESTTTMADTISHALINSGYSGQTLRSVPTMVKQSRSQSAKHDEVHSQSSAGDKLIYESVVSFDDRSSQTRNKMRRGIRRPPTTRTKVLSERFANRRIMESNHMHLKLPNAISLENLVQESMISSEKRLYDKIEHLTKSYFPSIQQLRRGHPCADLISSRMHLHREEKRDYIPMVYRARPV